MLTKYESLTSPAYVALMTLGLSGVALFGYSYMEQQKMVPGSGEDTVIVNAELDNHLTMMKKAGFYTAIGGVGLAVAYFLYQEFS